MTDSRHRVHHPTGWITEGLGRVFGPGPQPAPIRARSAQATALAGLQRRSQGARMVH